MQAIGNISTSVFDILCASLLCNSDTLFHIKYNDNNIKKIYVSDLFKQVKKIDITLFFSFDAASFEEAADLYYSGSGGKSCLSGSETSGKFILNANKKPEKSHYVATVTVNNNRESTSEFTQILAIDTTEPLYIM